MRGGARGISHRPAGRGPQRSPSGSALDDGELVRRAVSELGPGRADLHLPGHGPSRGVGRRDLERYVLRPALDESRLSWTRDGKVLYRFKRPWKDGTKLVVFEPLILIERLAALVPRPHRNLVTYHGAFAPAASSRERVVPLPPEDEGERPAFRSRQRRPSSAAGEKRKRKPHWRRRSTWAELMRRSFGVDVLVCPHCETRRRLLTFITDPRTIMRVLSHLGLPSELPPW